MTLSGCGSPVQCWNSGVPVAFLRRVDIIIPLSVSRSDIKDIIEDIIFIYVHNILVYFIYLFGINKSPFTFYVYFNFMINKVYM